MSQPSNRPSVNLAAPIAYASRLSERASDVAERAVPQLRDIAEPYRRLPEETLRDLVLDYVRALADSMTRGSLSPFDPFLDEIDQYWAPSGLGVSHVMRGLNLINDVCREVAPCDGDDTVAIEYWAREGTRLVTERSVAAINRKLADELALHRSNEERLVSLQRVSTVVLSEVDVESMLQTIVEEAMQLTGGQAAAIRLIDEETRSLRVIARAGKSDALLFPDAMPIEGSLAGHAYRAGEPVVSNDLEHDPRMSDDIRRASVLRSLLIVPLVVRDSSMGVLLVSDRTNGSFTDEDRRILGLFAAQAAAAIEHARLHEQAQHQIAELAALHRISNVISSSLEIENVFSAIYQEIRQVMTTDAFIIGLTRPDGLVDLDFIVDGGQRYSPRHAFEMSPMQQRAIAERRAVVIDDVHDEGIPPLYTVGHPQTRVRSIVTAPLLKGAEVVGLLSAQSYEPNTYREGDAQLLTTIANHAVVAVEHARLYRQAQHLAIAEERNRLAREIHDTLAQGLISIILYLERLDLKLEDVDDTTRELLDRALAMARENLEEARRSVHDLRAAPLEGRTLLEALQSMTANLRDEGVFTVDLRAPMTLPLFAARVETALLRVVQEAVSNCRKHAQCSSVSLDIDLDEDRLSVRVSDNGRGFDVDEARRLPDRYGLSSMIERVTQIGGQLDIESQPGRGTAINLSVPLDRAIGSNLDTEA